MDDGPLPLRVAGSVARWWWPILALAGFGTVAGLVFSHDHPAPGLSTRGLVTITLAALVVVLLTLHRAAGPWPLTRALAEYAVIAVLASLLVTDLGGAYQPPSSSTGAAAKAMASKAAPDTPPSCGSLWSSLPLLVSQICAVPSLMMW